MNKLFEEGIIKSIPQKWSQEQIDELLLYKSQKLNNKDIANKMRRTEISISIKLKRLTKTADTYNADHRTDKYRHNELFIFKIQPKTVLDVYAGECFYKKYDDMVVTDNDIDKSRDTAYNMDAFRLLCLLNYENKKYDLVDLDPFGSAIESFDLAIRLAKKGIVITLGEMGHKRFKRLDFVRRWYGINTLEDFTVDNIIKILQEMALKHKKNISPIYIREYNRISRVWFEIETIKIQEQWKK